MFNYSYAEPLGGSVRDPIWPSFLDSFVNPAPATPLAPTDIIFRASHEDGTLDEWHATSMRGSGSSIRAVRAADEGIPEADGEYVVKATMSGSESDYSRTHFEHADAGVANWGEGTEVWYSASFYLPDGFYDAKNSSNDIMRWDAYVDGSRDMQGGLGMRQDDTLRIMSNYSYTEPLSTTYKIPEGEWTQIEVHQKLSETDGKALNEIYVDGTLIGSSTTANFKGSAYPADEQAVNRLRVGLVSEGTIDDTNMLYFDNAVVSRASTTTSELAEFLPSDVNEPNAPLAFAAADTTPAESIGYTAGTAGHDYDWLWM